MKTVALACLGALTCLPLIPDVSVSALREPSFGKGLFIVVERTGDDATAIWDVDDEELEEVVTDAGEVLKLTVFGMTFVSPGDRDPTRKGFEKLEEDRSLLVFRFRAPQQPVKSIVRVAGTYELLSGGEEHWIDVPFAEVIDPGPWEDKVLTEAGFEITHGVREVQQLHLKVSGEVFDVSEVNLRLAGSDEDLHSVSSSGSFNSITYEFDIGVANVSKLTARIQLEDGTLVELGKLAHKSKFTKVKSAELAKAKLSLEVRQVVVREAFAEGLGDYDLLRGFRWVNKKGQKAGIFPHSQASGWDKYVNTSCRVPADLKRGVRLQLGVLVGTQRETVRFEYTNIDGPDK